MFGCGTQRQHDKYIFNDPINLRLRVIPQTNQYLINIATPRCRFFKLDELNEIDWSDLVNYTVNLRDKQFENTIIGINCGDYQIDLDCDIVVELIKIIPWKNR